LFNDASGLISFRFAVAAAITGSFSLGEALLTFLKVAAGGLFIGLVIAWVASAVYYWLVRWIGDEPGTPILISILIPFAAYLAAEHLGLSGIFAAVAAGISMHYANLIGRESAVTRMRRIAVWDMLQIALNGVIFVLLGLQLRSIIGDVPAIAHHLPGGHAAWLAGWLHRGHHAGACRAALCLGVGVTGRCPSGRHVARDPAATPFPALLARLGTDRSQGRGDTGGYFDVAVRDAGRGPFPARELAICLAMGVILLSLGVASVGLPLLTQDLELAGPRPIRSGVKRPQRGRGSRHPAARGSAKTGR
jgi:CPA1 family monovalent cation:H+ antiporter